MMASTIPTTHLNMKLLPLLQNILYPDTRMEVKPRRGKPTTVSHCYTTNHHHHHYHCSNIFKPKSSSFNRTVLTRVSADGGGGAQQSTTPSDIEEKTRNSSTFGDSYVAVFVRMLGLDHDPLDREQAIVALWKYSLGGKKCIDTIMQFRGCINLIINLLKSESSATCEAAAGFLRSIASVNSYRESVAECGAIEEINGLLSRSSLTAEVKEQSICTLWNLSVDEKLRVKIANSDILPLLIKSLDDEDIKVKEAAGGVLANLSLSHSNHNIMVEACVIPKLDKHNSLLNYGLTGFLLTDGWERRKKKVV